MLLAAWLAHGADAGRRQAEAKPAITVPFELLKTQHMAVQVKINGKGPYRVDLRHRRPGNAAEQQGRQGSRLFPKDFKAPPFALFGSKGQFKIKNLEMGELKVGERDTMVMDHPTVDGHLANALGPIEGIVGFTFFAKYRMTIDYQAKTMTFVPVKYQPVDMMRTLMRMLMDRRLKGNGKKVLRPGRLCWASG